MAITHAAVKTSGSRGYFGEWNDDHIVDDDSKPKNNTTLIVAASDSLDTTRADYVCDGVDDQVQILEAIAALPAGGGRISLLEGNFQITGMIVVNNDNVTIEGTGRSTILSTANNIRVLQSSNVTGILIHNIRIVGSNAGGVQDGIRWTNVQDGTIERVWIEDMGHQGIILRTTTSGCVVSSTFATNCSSSAIRIEMGANHNVITGCTITATLDMGINVAGDSNIITGCVTTGGAQTGIYITGNKTTISDCVSTFNTVNGIECWNVENVIEGNTCSDNVRNGIYVNNATNILIVGNICMRNDTGLVGAFDGILVTSSDHCIVASNRCAENNGWEISISNAACDKCLVHGNHCIGAVHVGAIQDNGTVTTVADNVIA